MSVAATRRLGRYELVRKLASGGMAEIWLARHPSKRGEWMVVKQIHPYLCVNDDFIVMFLDEARIAARLDHPGCVQIHDLGKDGDDYFLAMELIDGEDLRQIALQAHLEEAEIPIETGLGIIAGACDGLHYAHELKDAKGEPLRIVHRDVSPQNILVTYDGQVKIVDFGIAKAADRATHTRGGVLKGKYAYMSPEHITGGELDRRSDVFALGTLLYEITTSERLFVGDTDVDALRLIVSGDIRRPTSFIEDYPPELERIVFWALERKPEARCPSAKALGDALRTVLEDRGGGGEKDDLAAYMQMIFAMRLDRQRRALEEGDEAAWLEARFAPADRERTASSPSGPGDEISDQLENELAATAVTDGGDPLLQRIREEMDAAHGPGWRAEITGVSPPPAPDDDEEDDEPPTMLYEQSAAALIAAAEQAGAAASAEANGPDAAVGPDDTAATVDPADPDDLLDSATRVYDRPPVSPPDSAAPPAEAGDEVPTDWGGPGASDLDDDPLGAALPPEGMETSSDVGPPDEALLVGAPAATALPSWAPLAAALLFAAGAALGALITALLLS